MDVLSDILSKLRLRGTLYFSTELSRPWGIRVPAFERVARFHLVVRGRCWARVGGAEPIHLETGDLVLVPHGAEHRLSDEPDTACTVVDSIVQEAGFTGHGALVYGGEDRSAPTRLVCGHFAFAEGLEHPLVRQLPAIVPVRWEERVRGSPLEDAFRFIAREVQAARPGYEAVVSRLSEVLFVQAVRFWAERHTPRHGLLPALDDPGLAAALEAMHDEPERAWTLESLGRKAAMSRSAFSQRFKEVVGETPLHYLTRWRLFTAQELLRSSTLPLDRIARRVGYDSPASFSRAFKRVVGTPPGAYRSSYFSSSSSRSSSDLPESATSRR